MRFAVALTLVFLAGVMLAGAARAQGGSHPFCEEGRPANDDADEDADEEAAEPTHRAPAAILPCALVDSGILGSNVFGRGVLDAAGAPEGAPAAACADTPFYVVTHAGVLLCQVDVELFSASGAPALERAPQTLAQQSIASHAAATAGGVDELRPPTPCERVEAAPSTIAGGPLDENTWRPPRPS